MLPVGQSPHLRAAAADPTTSESWSHTHWRQPGHKRGHALVGSGRLRSSQVSRARERLAQGIGGVGCTKGHVVVAVAGCKPFPLLIRQLRDSHRYSQKENVLYPANHNQPHAQEEPGRPLHKEHVAAAAAGANHVQCESEQLRDSHRYSH
jgi:hypothetical protein